MRDVTVHLVRHGQSTWNAEHRLQGQTNDPPLTATGRTEAHRAAVQLAASIGGQPVQLISSDLVRAAQSAEIIAEYLHAPLGLDQRLREQHLGSLQGMPSAQLRSEPVPDGMHISEVQWGGGESIAEVYERLREFFDRYLPTAPRHLVLVTHGDTLRVARAVLTGRGHRDVEWDVVTNGAVVSLEVTWP